MKNLIPKAARFSQILALGCAVSIGYIAPGSAAEVYPHAYLIQRFSGFNNGGYIRLVNGQQDLCNTTVAANCSIASASIPSINKEMWVIFEGQTNVFEWLEAGQKRGLQLASLTERADNQAANQVSWKGHFIGRTLFEPTAGEIVSRSTPYSTQNPTGSATYQIKFTGSGTEWKIYVNGVQAYTVSSTGFTQANYIDVGIESKDDQNTFTSGTYSDNWQYLSSATWKNLSTVPSAIQKLRLNLYNSAWDVNYSTTNNRVTFTR